MADPGKISKNIIKTLSDGKTHQRDNVRETCISLLLSDDPSAGDDDLTLRFRSSIASLCKNGMIEKPEKSTLRITEKGISALKKMDSPWRAYGPIEDEFELLKAGQISDVRHMYEIAKDYLSTNKEKQGELILEKLSQTGDLLSKLSLGIWLRHCKISAKLGERLRGQIMMKEVFNQSPTFISDELNPLELFFIGRSFETGFLNGEPDTCRLYYEKSAENSEVGKKALKRLDAEAYYKDNKPEPSKLIVTEKFHSLPYVKDPSIVSQEQWVEVEEDVDEPDEEQEDDANTSSDKKQFSEYYDRICFLNYIHGKMFHLGPFYPWGYGSQMTGKRKVKKYISDGYFEKKEEKKKTVYVFTKKAIDEVEANPNYYWLYWHGIEPEEFDKKHEPDESLSATAYRIIRKRMLSTYSLSDCIALQELHTTPSKELARLCLEELYLLLNCTYMLVVLQVETVNPGYILRRYLCSDKFYSDNFWLQNGFYGRSTCCFNSLQKPDKKVFWKKDAVSRKISILSDYIDDSMIEEIYEWELPYYICSKEQFKWVIMTIHKGVYSKSDITEMLKPNLDELISFLLDSYDKLQKERAKKKKSSRQ